MRGASLSTRPAGPSRIRDGCWWGDLDRAGWTIGGCRDVEASGLGFGADRQATHGAAEPGALTEGTLRAGSVMLMGGALVAAAAGRSWRCLTLPHLVLALPPARIPLVSREPTSNTHTVARRVRSAPKSEICPYLWGYLVRRPKDGVKLPRRWHGHHRWHGLRRRQRPSSDSGEGSEGSSRRSMLDPRGCVSPCPSVA
jgi:hypothetical protein